MGFKSKLSPKDLEKAQAELNEDPKTRKDKIKELLTRCKSSPKVPASFQGWARFFKMSLKSKFVTLE